MACGGELSGFATELVGDDRRLLRQTFRGAVAAITFAIETVVPAAIGLALLGDAVRGSTWPLAIAGFVITLGSCFVLAGQSEPDA